jgi:hypothetical protein
MVGERVQASARVRQREVGRLAVIWKTLLVAEQIFQRLDAPELLADVAEGADVRHRCAREAEPGHD